MAHDLAVSLKDITAGDLFVGDNGVWLMLKLERTDYDMCSVTVLNLKSLMRHKWPWSPGRPLYFREHWRVGR